MGDIQMDTIPSPLLYRVKKLSGLSKQTIKIVPSSGQSDVYAGQKIIISLPSNSLLDLSTCILNFSGGTSHAGGKADCVKCRYFPRNIASIIENLEIKMGGQTIQNISQYGYLYNILYDLTQGKDGESRRKIGEHCDPSYSVSPTNEVNIGYNALSSIQKAEEFDFYSIRSWLGFLGGNASTNVLDTALCGDIQIEITLSSPACLMLGSSLLSTGLDGVGGAINAANPNFILKNISLTCVKYDMPGWYYDSIRRNLESGAVYPIYYPNYSAFNGSPTTDKSCSTRFSVSTGSLDMVIGTFQPQNRTTIGTVLNSEICDANGGGKEKTANNLVNNGALRSFNNSIYYQRDGNGVVNSTWTIGHVQLNPSTLPEQFNNCLTSFGISNDTLGGISPLIQSLYHFKDTFYCDILSTKFVGDNDSIYSVSGMDSKEQVITIGWDVVGGGLNATYGYPLLYACYNSHVDISANRFVQYHP